MYYHLFPRFRSWPAFLLTKKFTLYKAFPLLPRPPDLLHQRPCAPNLAHTHVLHALDPPQDRIFNSLIFRLHSRSKHWKQQTRLGITTLGHPLQCFNDFPYSILHLTCRTRAIVYSPEQMNEPCPMKGRIRPFKAGPLVMLVDAHTTV